MRALYQCIAGHKALVKRNERCVVCARPLKPGAEKLPEPNKFGARKTKVMFDGIEIYCPSALEAAVAGHIDNLRILGEASELRYQHCVDLGNGVRWKVDFSYWSKSRGERVWVEAKGKVTEGYSIKRRIWKGGAGPGRLEIWKGDWRRPVCVEVIYPEAASPQEVS